MDRMIKKRCWFDNKTCYFCKKPANIFRVFRDDSVVLCEKRECNNLWMTKMGMFNHIGLKFK